jgi:hypothetical protein
VFRPEMLLTNDYYKPADYRFPYDDFPFNDRTFDAVVFDPPYKLSGTPSCGTFDTRYGIAEKMSNGARLDDIVDGATECLRVCSAYLLVKCQDQVAGGRVRWQTDLVTEAIVNAGGTKVDRFDLVTTPRPQPAGRCQMHARRNHSTLLVFAR